MQPGTFCRLFLIDLLLLAYTADRAAKPNANIERHRCNFGSYAADAYTSDESHCCARIRAPKRDSHAYTFNGCGTRFYGEREPAKDGSYITTEWIT